MRKHFYKKTTPLVSVERENSSTASITCYFGEMTYKDDDTVGGFVEITDCRNKIDLHWQNKESFRDWMDKITTLRDELNEYLAYLEIKTTLI